jgi:hypothetical protein
MATYKNTNEYELTFPSLQDADGNVLVVEAGGTFDGPDGLTNAGIVLTSKPTKTTTTDTTETTEKE